MVRYRMLNEKEISFNLFKNFNRRQIVTKCWRKQNGSWILVDAPFVDDWTEENFKTLVKCLKNTVATGGFVYAAFYNDKLKGFVSVAPDIFGDDQKYLDLSSIHVSAEMRGKGIGKILFNAAKEWARKKGAKKLYISAHSALESQAFYRAMGCTEAEVYNKRHVEKEPFDCQLECRL